MREWQLLSASADKIQTLSQELKISPLVARLLVNRGLDDVSHARTFLTAKLADLPSPYLMQDLERGVDRLVSAIQAGEKIGVYGDYDVDGSVASSLLILFFRELGLVLDSYTPHRVLEGYSLNRQALDKIKARGVRVLLTVDNGIGAHEPARYAKEIGLDLIITDHHQVPSILPTAYAVINPHRHDCQFPGKEICGTGVAFYLMMALRQKLRELGYFAERAEPNLKRYLDLVALATVADVMPLQGINRVFVRLGLEVLNGSTWPGMEALKQVCAVKGPIHASHLGFRLGPRINAGGRLEVAQIAIDCLTAITLDEALPFAHKLDALNRDRQNVEEKIRLAAVQQLQTKYSEQDFGYVLVDDSWHLGVIGIVASRIVEQFNRPTILLVPDGAHYKGSARSCGGIHLVKSLEQCRDLLIQFGGHEQAAGLTLQKNCIASFRERWQTVIKEQLAAEGWSRRIKLDASLQLEEIDERLIQEIGCLAPFGMGNPEPVFLLENTQPQGIKLVGEKHLKFYANKNQRACEVIAFGRAEDESWIKQCEQLDLACTVSLNDYWQPPRVVLQARDFRKS